MGKKKKRALGPRRKRMNQVSRLQSARNWIPTYRGTSIIRGYRNWFGVDWECAIRELRMLGVKLDEKHVAQLQASHQQRIRHRQIRAEQKKKEESFENIDSDGTFAYIAGYTSWGFPYGITRDEIEESVQ